MATTPDSAIFSDRAGWSAVGTYSISPNNSADLAIQPRGIYVGGAGDIACVMGANTVTFAGALAGTLLPIGPTRVMSSGTTATLLLALH